MPEGYALHRFARLRQRRFAGSVVCVSSSKQRVAAPAACVGGPERISTFDA
ncbi:hypothetical protein [Nocardia sp. NPDC049526]|uniref:hypothetical protein n=1 Tax=Nocardia sp. NPDC049526 TaxID=3364316 RepID=UPI00379A4188